MFVLNQLILDSKIGEEMNKKSFLVILLAIVSLLLSACGESSPPNPIPFARLEFVVEENPDYIGSYSVKREDPINGSTWVEWGEWTPIQALVGREIVCFGYFDEHDGYGTFRARSDYHWVEVEFDGRMCLELAKK